jgi:hypothetical protein
MSSQGTVVELVDTPDLKSVERMLVRVQVPLVLLAHSVPNPTILIIKTHHA